VLAIHERVTSASMTLTDCLKKLTAHQCHVINLCQKQNLSGQIHNTETPVNFVMLTNATIGTKESASVPVKTRHDN
jgi:hypothetical protein